LLDWVRYALIFDAKWGRDSDAFVYKVNYASALAFEVQDSANSSNPVVNVKFKNGTADATFNTLMSTDLPSFKAMLQVGVSGSPCCCFFCLFSCSDNEPPAPPFPHIIIIALWIQHVVGLVQAVQHQLSQRLRHHRGGGGRDFVRVSRFDLRPSARLAARVRFHWRRHHARYRRRRSRRPGILQASQLWKEGWPSGSHRRYYLFWRPSTGSKNE
jgi:hypothetical protein